MKVIMLYRPNSEHARSAEAFVRDFQHQTDKRIELVNIDSREGVQMADLYGIVQHPAIIAVDNDGHMQQMWQGAVLPLMNEVAYYAVEP